MISKRQFVAGAASLFALAGCGTRPQQGQDRFLSALHEDELKYPPLPPPSYGVMTKSFHDLRNGFPWLDDTRKSVAWVSGKGWWGSAVLLDMQGTAVFCQHETDKGRVMNAVFPVQNQVSAEIRRILGRTTSVDDNGYSLPLENVWRLYANPNQDIAFIQLPPERVALLGLKPVKWGQSPSADTETGAILVGFPGNAGKIDAQLVYAITPTGPVRMEKTAPTLCNDIGESIVRPGDSGGAIFDMDSGALLGITKARVEYKNSLVASVVFVPVDAVKDAYSQLFPERARLAGVSASPQTGACAFQKSDFMTFADAPPPQQVALQSPAQAIAQPKP